MPLSGCVKTPLGIVAEWFASELKDDERAAAMRVEEEGREIRVRVARRDGWQVNITLQTAWVIGGAEDPKTTAALTNILREVKERL
jgi:hypothetical protein